MPKIVKIAVDDRVTMRKPHPCGSYDWYITRVGADVGLRCVKCRHRVLLPRDHFEHEMRRCVPARPGQEADLWRVK